MPSCNTYNLTWVFLTWDEGYLLTAATPDLKRGVAPLGPPVPTQPLLLGRGVAPPSHRPCPITSWQIDEATVETVADFILGAPKSLQMVTAAMKLKDAYSLEGKL